MLNKYIGDRTFYRRVVAVAVPILIQNGITNFVSLLDNIMVGQVGTMQMSGVSIVNQLLFVFNLCIFGAVSGAGIFTAQFHGNRNDEGIRHTFRFKILACLLLTVLGCGIFLLGGDGLIRLYLQGEGNPEEAQAALTYGKEYMLMMLWGLLPFALCNAYSGTLRETDQTVVPMVGGILAVGVNLALNYVLIFGHFGAPAMGVRGAALATVISRYAELFVVAGWTHLNAKRNPFIRGAYRSMRMPRRLFRDIVIKGMPLMVNEFLWSTGMAIMNQCYSTCGLSVVPAMNISTTVYNLASVSFIAMGNSVGIIMGQMLGSGAEEPEVRDTNRKLIAVSVAGGVFFGGLMAMGAGVFPRLYNTDGEVQQLATRLILICAVMIPFNAYCNAAYFTLRSGGQTMVTFLFDSCFVWGLCVPLAFCLSRFTGMGILPLFILCQSTEFLKCALGAIVIRQGRWMKNLTQ